MNHVATANAADTAENAADAGHFAMGDADHPRAIASRDSGGVLRRRSQMMNAHSASREAMNRNRAMNMVNWRILSATAECEKVPAVHDVDIFHGG